MLSDLNAFFPEEAKKVFLVLFLSFLIGLEREEHKVKATSYSFGGIRTFPLIGLIGYLCASLSSLGSTTIASLGIGLGLIVIGAFLIVSYHHKISSKSEAGVTTEVSGLLTYLLGALVYFEKYWLSVSIVVVATLLLELKEGLENLTKKIESDEIVTFAKFLLITFVILPIVPNKPLTLLKINFFKVWLVVVVVSIISYGSYVLNKILKGRGGVLITAILGGAYSSTATTFLLAKESKEIKIPSYVSGAILIASSIMYLRILVLVLAFNFELYKKILFILVLLFIIGFILGYFLYRKEVKNISQADKSYTPKNPLDLTSALIFAFTYILIYSFTQIFIENIGENTVYYLAVLLGFSDVDPFILTLTQSTEYFRDLSIPAKAIILATLSNNILKGVYAYIFGERKSGFYSFILLLIYSFIGAILTITLL